MKVETVSCLVFLSLAGCFPARPAAVAPSPTLPAVCGDAGVVAKSSIPSSTPGLPYEFEVYLPPCYDAQPDRKFPVLYLIPGRSSIPETWIQAGAAEKADEMIHLREIPPFLIVSTQNIDDDPQAEEIQTLLMPYVESTYRIPSDRRYRAVAGGSLGGIATYRIGFQHPDRYSSLALFGSGVEPVEEDRVRAWLAAIPKEDTLRVFFNTGTDDAYMLDTAKLAIRLLDEAHIPHTEIFTPGPHSYQYWATNLHDFFLWLSWGWR